MTDLLVSKTKNAARSHRVHQRAMFHSNNEVRIPFDVTEVQLVVMFTRGLNISSLLQAAVD